MDPNFDPIPKGVSFETHRRNLPHWEQKGRVYFITWRLADAVPVKELEWLGQKRQVWLQSHPKPWDRETQVVFYRLFEKKYQYWLDRGFGSCVLRNPRIRELVICCLNFFDGQRYVLDDFVVMPNHVHVLMMPLAGHGVSQIAHSWKSFSANAINHGLNQKGRLWMKEVFDVMVRSRQHLQKYRNYIRENPVKANLSKNEFSLGKGTGIDSQK